ncbi:PSD1 and planctomycete cytochrome C domain-containing protein [Stieleria sp. ICT_E10.1]|uniref:PSD1 and planctomycete cytochrome C domain-containing protein n=1 Tax=Stieleria sedimenti TaxID=2976331 RepID=UPI00217FCD1F|nr:PSD1 and planctomycete cytochrome C domain-containing protein [Stieleria sedimenti]MCS7465931.1 PSD1 and planctomycete cytochrome C domain-containing protein [Stieleria sedimenti]
MSLLKFPDVVLAGVIVTTSFVSVVAAEPESTPSVDFAKDVYPILQRSCFECHGSEKQEAGLRLDRRHDLLESGSVEPGNPQESELLRRVILPRGHDEIMPAIGDPLSASQVDALRRWIAAGAVWPETFVAAQHWAYVAPRRPSLPDVRDTAWPQSPIDHFVLHRLETENLTPAPKARPEKLIRRLYLDLIGLPPTPSEVDAFVRDPSRRHYESIVDSLLSRPQFGERWARPWLDLARYADSHGFQRDNFRDIWAYRDWVIHALNNDMPFDQFTIEQVAGDLLPGATASQKIATGFHRCTPTNVEAGSLPEETRIEQVIDRVNTTGAVWLGTTLECCQCHDHKYDPFTTKEYYRLLAYFNNTVQEADRANPKQPSSIKFQGPSMPLEDPPRDQQRMALQRQLDDVKGRQQQLREQLSAGLDEWGKELSKSVAQSPQAHTLEIIEFESEGSTDSYERLDDGSILLQGGDPPDKDQYRVLATAQTPRVTAIRLDVLLDESLPDQGPGRNERRNFVLNDFQVERVANAGADSGAETDERNQSLSFTAAKASFSQQNYPVAGAIDDDPKSGWAISPQQGKPHWATFVLDEPIELAADQPLAITMTQHFGRALTIGRFKLSVVTGDVDAEAVPEAIARAARKSPAEWSDKERKTLVQFRVERDRAFKALDKQIAQLQKQINQLSPDTTLVMIELDQPRTSAVFERGDYRSPGDPVQPGTPAVLHPRPDGPETRLTLARWLVSRDNPLVARVTVNRWWMELFGAGIVTTPEDFGIKGEPPSHPQLLDWLAIELMDRGWSMKGLLKTIVTSATYQQSSNLRDELRDLDAENRLLARGPRFRMDAEMIRDNALAISGLLSLRQHGPSIRPYQPDGVWSKVGGEAYDYEVSPGGERYRRGIYVVVKRGSPYPSFINFDATARLACTVKRSRTNTPLQALTLLNDPVYVEAARALSSRIAAERGEASIDDQIAFAFQWCTARQPNASELATLRHLYRQQSGSADPMYGVATALLNLHETITKD